MAKDIDLAPLLKSTWWRPWAGVVVCYAAFLGIIDAKLWRPGWDVHPGMNANIAEAEAWLDGRLDLGTDTGVRDRQWDTAVVGEQVFNHFPPAFTLVSLAVLPWSPEGVPHWLIVALLALPLPGLAYLLFARRTGRPLWAIVLALGYLLGTSLLPVTQQAIRSGTPWHVNHALSQLGLLIFLIEIFGRRRIWLVGIGLALACWSRPTTVAYCLPVLWLVWWGTSKLGMRHKAQGTRHKNAESKGEDRQSKSETEASDRREGSSGEDHGQAGACPCHPAGGGGARQRARRLVVAGLLVIVVLAVPLTLNALKFGGPLDSGYAHIYAGRTGDKLAQAAEHGIFSLRFVPRNLYYMNLGFPRFVFVAGQWHWRPNLEATGIWWTTPVLLGTLIFFGRIRHEPVGLPLLIAIGVIWVALLCFHNTGWEQRGYNRFSLDYVPVMLALAAPYVTAGYWRWATLAATGWSVAYFAFML